MYSLISEDTLFFDDKHTLRSINFPFLVGGCCENTLYWRKLRLGCPLAEV